MLPPAWPSDPARGLCRYGQYQESGDRIPARFVPDFLGDPVGEGRGLPDCPGPRAFFPLSKGLVTCAAPCTAGPRPLRVDTGHCTDGAWALQGPASPDGWQRTSLGDPWVLVLCWVPEDNLGRDGLSTWIRQLKISWSICLTQVGKLRPRKGKWLVHGHYVTEWCHS